MIKRIKIFTGALTFSMLILIFSQAGYAFTKSGRIYSTDGSVTDIMAAVHDSAYGDTINVPPGTYEWGANSSYIYLDGVTLNGAGTNQTFINVSATGASYKGVVRIHGLATVANMTINGASSGQAAAFDTQELNGWRITGILFNGGINGAYFALATSYGVIDHCVINGNAGNAELIFGRGPQNSWQTPSSLGTTNAVYIEDCIFGGVGYVCDANSNARFVIRFCTINGRIKIDGHGKASNSPPRGVRHMEVYGNHWTNTSSFWAAIELRGGSGMVFDNLYDGDGSSAWFYLREYGCTGQWQNFNNTYQTPVNYPIDDQIGVGMDPKAAGSEPMYLWNNKSSGGSVDWPLSWNNPPSGAIALYQTQTGNPNATFTLQDNIIVADRDYFKGTNGVAFNGSGGVGRGTKAQMLAITPTKKGVGFWVTDEGQWNNRHPGPSGQFYVWDGFAWVFKYRPYTYPFAYRRPAPPANLKITN